MAKSNDMREQLQRVESTVDVLAKRVEGLDVKVSELTARVEQLPTKADLSGFATKDDLTALATKADLTVFKEEIIKNFSILAEDAKASAQKAAEGYGATLNRIERELGKRNKSVRTKLSDHDQALTNHVGRIVALEQATGLTPK